MFSLLKNYNREEEPPIKRNDARCRIALWLLLSVCLLNALPTRSYAWGSIGHKVVALIAQERLTPKASREVDRLLDDQSLSSISNDADRIRNSEPETAPWHFVDIPKNENAYDAERDCPETEENDTEDGDCIIEAVKHFKSVLGNRSESDEDRAKALIFLVHFIGDLHQPLHCIDDGDRGGNEVKATFFGKRTNLHSVWDSGIIERSGLTDTGFARSLLDRLTPQEAAEMQKGGEIDWANESHRLAIANVYKIPEDKALDASYYNANSEVVKKQLTRAGVRLAKVLNDLLN